METWQVALCLFVGGLLGACAMGAGLQYPVTAPEKVLRVRKALWLAQRKARKLCMDDVPRSSPIDLGSLNQSIDHSLGVVERLIRQNPRGGY